MKGFGSQGGKGVGIGGAEIHGMNTRNSDEDDPLPLGSGAASSLDFSDDVLSDGVLSDGEIGGGEIGGGKGAARLGGVLVLAAVLGLAWLAFQRNDGRAPAVSPSLAEARAAAGHGHEAFEPSADPVAFGSAVGMVPQAGASAVLVEDCGLGASGAPGAQRSADEVAAALQGLERSRERFQRALTSGSDESLRAVGLAMRSAGGPRRLDTNLECEGNHCPAVPERVESTAAARERIAANAAPRDALARLALTSTSAQVYGMAWQTCQAQGASDANSACGMLSAEQWARLDPANAVTWLELASAARTRGEAATLDEAMFQVSKARSLESSWGRAIDAALQRMPADVPAVDALIIAGELHNLATSDGSRTHLALDAYCSADGMRDANRQQRCAEISDLLVGSRAQSLLDLTTGMKLGERAGWSHARLKSLADERAAVSEVLARQGPGTSAPSTCEALRQRLDFMRGVVREGELPFARQTIRAGEKGTTEPARPGRVGGRSAAGS